MKKLILSGLGSILILSSVFLNGFLLSGCKTFEPIIIEGQPMDCNDMYSFILLANKFTGTFKKDTQLAAQAMTLVSFSYSKCIAARLKLKNAR